MTLTQFLQSSFSVNFLYPSLVALALAYFCSLWRRTMKPFWITLGVIVLLFLIGSALVEMQ